MSTAALVGYVYYDESMDEEEFEPMERERVRFVRVHANGPYLAPVLSNYEGSEIFKLIDMGDISHLAPEIGESNSFLRSEFNLDVCRFYHRDRDEDWEEVAPSDVSVTDGHGILMHLAELMGAYYIYIYDDMAGSEWICYERSTHSGRWACVDLMDEEETVAIQL